MKKTCITCKHFNKDNKKCYNKKCKTVTYCTSSNCRPYWEPLYKVQKQQGAKCKHCGDELYSEYVRDFQDCTCGSIYVDGGYTSFRVGYHKIDDYIPIERTIHIEMVKPKVDVKKLLKKLKK